jgi:hypothetical protein
MQYPITGVGWWGQIFRGGDTPAAANWSALQPNFPDLGELVLGPYESRALHIILRLIGPFQPRLDSTWTLRDTASMN